MAGLIYEIVWARYLALFLGQTSYAIIMVLTTFMTGLALGSFWLGRRADLTPRPLALYGWLEVGIGGFALVFPWYYSACHKTFVALAAGLTPGWFGLLALKCFFSLLAILLPTMLMGGTLPVLAKFLTRSMPDLRGKVAKLYAINSAGAVLGCLLADFWLLHAIGLRGTVFCAAGLNLFAGGVALALNRWGVRRSEPTETGGSPSASVEAVAAVEGQDEQFSAKDLRLAVIAIGISGFVAMLYEVAWTRLLALVLGSSTHAFGIMLGTFITGLAIGAWVIARRQKAQRTISTLGWAELVLGLTVLASMFLYEYLPYGFMKLGSLLARRDAAYPLYEFMQALICFTVMLVPTICLGMTLPLASRAATRELRGAGSALGGIYAINTVGAVLGAALTGLWLMPSLGLARTFALGVSANFLLAVLILGRNLRVPRPLTGVIATIVLAGLVWWAGAQFRRWPQTFMLGLWRHDGSLTWPEWKVMVNSVNLKFYRDGAGSTVSVHGFTDGKGQENLALRVNGKTDATTTGDMPTQLLLGHLPMLLHPESKRALVIGLGSGATCGAVALHPTIQRLDAVEISPDVARAARLFSPHNHAVLDDARFHLVVDDAKSYLQITTNCYDVIVSEPSNPWMAGVAGVFTREFYESCRERLQPGGLMTQWVHFYETTDEALDIVLQTFACVFPHASVWRIKADLLLVGSAEPVPVNLKALAARFHHPSVEADLRRMNFWNVAQLLACQQISEENARYVPPPGTREHLDLNPCLEYVAQRAFFARRTPIRWIRLDEAEAPRPSTLLGSYLKEHPLTVEEIRPFVTCFFGGHGSARIVRGLLERWHELAPDDPDPIHALAQLPPPENQADSEAQRLGAIRDILWKKADTDPAPLRLYRQHLWQRYAGARTAFYVPPSKELQDVLARLLQADPTNHRSYKLELARLAWDGGHDRACAQLGLSALGVKSDAAKAADANMEVAAEIIAHIAESAVRDGEPQRALQVCQMAADAHYSSTLLDVVGRKLKDRLSDHPAPISLAAKSPVPPH